MWWNILLDGIGNLRMGIYQQQMVPLNEMTDVMRVVKEQVGLKPKQWVRIKRGVFKDDLAQVSSIHSSILPKSVLSTR